MKEVCRLTGEKKKGPAIRKLVADSLMLKRREKFIQKVLSGEWGIELEGFEESQKADRKKELRRARRWRA